MSCVPSQRVLAAVIATCLMSPDAGRKHYNSLLAITVVTLLLYAVHAVLVRN